MMWRAIVARILALDRRQLRQQALRNAARRDAGRLERLHAPERDLHLLDRGRRVEVGDLDHLLEIGAQVAVVVQGLHDHLREHEVAQRKRQHGELAVQVRRERGRHRHHVERARLVVVRALARAEAVRLPHVAIAFAGQLALGGTIVSVAALRASRRRRRPRRAARLGGVFGLGVFLEEGVLAKRVMHLLRELEGGQLQQPHRMLEARRQGLLLALFGAKVQRTHRNLLYFEGWPRPGNICRAGVHDECNATPVPELRCRPKNFLAGSFVARGQRVSDGHDADRRATRIPKAYGGVSAFVTLKTSVFERAGNQICCKGERAARRGLAGEVAKRHTDCCLPRFDVGPTPTVARGVSRWPDRARPRLPPRRATPRRRLAEG
jgi:hypothetical protein